MNIVGGTHAFDGPLGVYLRKSRGHPLPCYVWSSGPGRSAVLLITLHLEWQGRAERGVASAALVGRRYSILSSHDETSTRQTGTSARLTEGGQPSDYLTLNALFRVKP